MNQISTVLLESLRPNCDAKIMDLVAAAGIDVSAWAKRNDGSPVDNPRANPNYCYQWAFGGGGEPTALCIWHNSLAELDGVISYEDSVRQYALKLDRIAIDRSNPAHVRARARDQAKRARSFDSLLQRAFRGSQPIRVVLLQGEPRSEAELGWDTSKVSYRLLDPQPWYVHSYRDDDGISRVVRRTLESSSPTAPTFVDQFSIPGPPEKNEVAGSTFARSAEVRQSVLRRWVPLTLASWTPRTNCRAITNWRAAISRGLRPVLRAKISGRRLEAIDCDPQVAARTMAKTGLHFANG